MHKVHGPGSRNPEGSIRSLIDSGIETVLTRSMIITIESTILDKVLVILAMPTGITLGTFARPHLKIGRFAATIAAIDAIEINVAGAVMGSGNGNFAGFARVEGQVAIDHLPRGGTIAQGVRGRIQIANPGIVVVGTLATVQTGQGLDIVAVAAQGTECGFNGSAAAVSDALLVGVHHE